MSNTTIIRNATLVNEGKTFVSDLLMKHGRIERIDSSFGVKEKLVEINAEGKYLLPGIIDDQVHFREPGLTHKADVFSESRAAVAGGVTSFMEMPNTIPPAFTLEELEKKYAIASRTSAANYSFYLGTSNDNLEEIKRLDPKKICGIKIFMGSSTGKLVVDNNEALENIFREAPTLIATHCETDSLIQMNLEFYLKEFGEEIPMEFHPMIRDAEQCLISSQRAVEFARKYNSRLHIFHLSTASELSLFTNEIPLEQKRITAEVCVHHLHFSSADYAQLGGLIKCNPAIKAPEHRDALWTALLDDRLDVIATDHAPHTWEEKHAKGYSRVPSGLPLVQHGFNLMFEKVQEGKISLEKLISKMCHAPARLFQISERGYMREGYHADLFLFDPKKEWTVSRENILYKCGWSPFEGISFRGKATHTFVNGELVCEDGKMAEGKVGQRLEFER